MGLFVFFNNSLFWFGVRGFVWVVPFCFVFLFLGEAGRPSPL